MKAISLVLVAALAALAQAPHQLSAQSPDLRSAVQQLFTLANQSRAQAGSAPLQWDPALAAAALQHCKRMAAEGPISHRYGGEPDVTDRTAQAGAHFSLIEENVAVGPTASEIHDGWMHSPGHRENLLNPQVDHVGIALVYARGVLYAVADYSAAVKNLSPAQVEARVASMIRASGVSIMANPAQARSACASDNGLRQSSSSPAFMMRWQNSDLSQLPPELVSQLHSGRYHQAAVGSCSAEQDDGAFTSYRVAVLLY